MKTFLVVICALLLVPAVASAASVSEAAPSVCAPSSSMGALPVFDFQALSTCTAFCDDGTTRTCSGGSCSAVDSSCSPTVRGYCSSDVEGTKYCPTPTCFCTPTCNDLNGQFCKSSGTCYTGSGHFCQAHTCDCINFAYSCPIS